MTDFSFTEKDINEMNLTNTWKNSIKIHFDASNNSNTKYKLYPSGEANLNGRKYYAISENIILNDEIIKKNNLWISDSIITKHNMNIINKN